MFCLYFQNRFHDIAHHVSFFRNKLLEFSQFLDRNGYFIYIHAISFLCSILLWPAPMTGQPFTVQNKAIHKKQDSISASCFIYPIKTNHKLTSHVSAEIFLKQFEYASLQFTLFFTDVLDKEWLMRNPPTLAKSNSSTSPLAEGRKNEWDLHQVPKE